MVQGVRAATPMVPFISTYRTPTSIVPADAVDASQILAVVPGLTVAPSIDRGAAARPAPARSSAA